MNYMNENTNVLVYGVCTERKNLIAESFDWEKILSNFMQLTKNEFNNRVFTYKNFYSFSAHGKSICVHTGDSEIIARAKALLTTAVSEYYHCKCYICINVDSGYFSPLVTVSMLMKSESYSYGAKTGEIIEFGRYPQGSNSEIQPVRWKVLNIEENTALLLAEDCLMMSGYCDMKKAYGNLWYLMWGNCLAREMCNGHFYHEAFDSTEKSIIKPKVILETIYGPRCEDKVFLLSEGEAALFMDAPEDRRAKLSLKLQTEENRKKPYSSGEYASWWLFPEEGDREVIYPKAVWPNGEIQYHSRNGYHSDFTIRPCILINLDQYKKHFGESTTPKSSKDIKTGTSFATKLSKLLLKKEDTGKKETASPRPKISGGQAYSLAYIQGYEGIKRDYHAGARYAWHDKTLGEWRLTIQLDNQGIWFLSVFVKEDGRFEKYSLDYEMTSDFHYEFRDEKGLRKKIYSSGDEKKYLAEVLIRYVQMNGGNALLSALHPFITAQYHHD